MVENIEQLYKKQGLHTQNFSLIMLKFDTVIDMANPSLPLYAYKNNRGNITEAQLMGYAISYDYHANGRVKKSVFTKNNRILTTHFDTKGSLLFKEEKTDNSHTITRMHYDTTFKTFLNPAEQPYLITAQINREPIFSKSMDVGKQLYIKEFGGAPFKLQFPNKNWVTNVLNVDSLKLQVLTSTQYFNSNVKYTTTSRDTVNRMDSVVSYTINPAGDTILMEYGYRNFNIHSLNLGLWKYKIHHPHHPVLYQKEIWVNGKFGFNKKYYNNANELIAIQYTETNPPGKGKKNRAYCGTPNLVTKEVIPGYQFVYNLNGDSIDSEFTSHPNFSHQSYFFAFPVIRPGFFYKSNQLPMSSENEDILLTEQGDITVYELRKQFLFYLWKNNIKHNEYPINFVMVYYPNRGWHLSYNKNIKKADTFEKAFRSFISSYGNITAKPHTDRALILIQSGKTQRKKWPITEIWWEIEW